MPLLETFAGNLCFKCIKCSLQMFLNHNDVIWSPPRWCQLQLWFLNTESVCQDVCSQKFMHRQSKGENRIFMKKKQISNATFLRMILSHLTKYGSEHPGSYADIQNIPVWHICNAQFHVRTQWECSSHFTQTCLAYLKYRDDGLFQWKDCCKQCDNSERGCVSITAVPQVQTQSDMTLVLIIQHTSWNTAL